MLLKVNVSEKLRKDFAVTIIGVFGVLRQRVNLDHLMDRRER